MRVYPQQVTKDSLRVVPLLAYIATILLANWAVTEYGFREVGFGYVAPAGVFFAGLAFTFRDLTHESLGRWAVIGAIIVGALLSWWVSNPSLALASGVAFFCSEMADLVVYEPLRERRWLTAVALSNVVGLVVDSALFLWLAFGSLDFIWGQIIAKSYMTIIAVIVLWIARKVHSEVLSRNPHAELVG